MTSAGAAPSDADSVVVVGGGVIGAFCAWELAQAGRKVTLVERDRFGAGCSHGNCGYVCPSHVLPLSVPGAVAPALRGMLRPNSPLKIKPRLSPALWSWLWHFSRRCNRRDMLESGAARHALLDSSMELYSELLQAHSIDCQWRRQGLLFVYDTPHHFEAARETNKLLHEEFGVVATPYEGVSLQELEPALKPELAGGWHYEGDCHLRPDRLMTELRRLLEQRGVELREHWEFARLQGQGERALAAIDGRGEQLGAGQFVFAAGAMTPLLAREIGCRLPIQPGKGYSITTSRPAVCPRIPLIFERHRVAVTPLEDAYRIGSTMEFAGYDTTLNPKRLQLLRRGAEHYLRQPYGETVEEQWFGWRPMTWDGKPIIGRSPRWQNVWVASGHNMLGLSMAPATGRLLAELLDDRPPHIDPRPYRPDRF